MYQYLLTLPSCLFHSASLASLTRETGPKVIRGDPERKQDSAERKFEHSKPHFTLQPNISDSALKFTHIMYNLSPGGQHTCRSIFFSTNCSGFALLLIAGSTGFFGAR